jgi:hypothetical protein
MGHLPWVLALLLCLDSSHAFHTTGVAQGLGSIGALTPLRGASRATLHACLDFACAWLCLLLILLGLTRTSSSRPKGKGRIARMLIKVAVAALHLLHFSARASGQHRQVGSTGSNKRKQAGFSNSFKECQYTDWSQAVSLHVSCRKHHAGDRPRSAPDQMAAWHPFTLPTPH